MGQFKDISIKDIIDEINESYFLPDIQREYVWLERAAEKKIEQLFDSILRGYPIGSFLFWKLTTSDIETDKSVQENTDKLNFQLYKFIEDYDVRKPHNEKIDIAKIRTGDINVVLDGQQRLTSLYIGLLGTRTLKKPRGWWDNPSSFETKKLYLNLRYIPNEENTEDCYKFEFKVPSQIPLKDEYNNWFKVGDILTIDPLDYYHENNLTVEEGKILSKLKNVICAERIISYFEEKDKNLDKVLKIFIRVNSGGTQLSYSDLLMSILTANFSSDIRSLMNGFVDSIKNLGFGCFGRDQVLKTCLILTGANHIFNLKNFKKANIREIENRWYDITDKILSATKILRDCGYANQLSSGYVISVIALYLFKNSICLNAINNEDRAEMWSFIRAAQIQSYFSTALDSKLTTVIEVMNGVTSFKDFNDRMANLDANKALRVTKDDVEALLTLQYGSYAVLPVLQVLYPNLDYKNSTFHIDHIYPKSKFTQHNKRLPQNMLGEANYLYNLQLLEGQENEQKRDKDPDVWISSLGDDNKMKSYKENNYIESDFSMKWEDIEAFKELRNKKLKEYLIKVLG